MRPPRSASRPGAPPDPPFPSRSLGVAPHKYRGQERRGTFERLLQQYDYLLLPESIALRPAQPRDSAKLLVFDRQTHEITTTTFRHLGDWLPTGSVLVLNDTKVIPARLLVRKPSGGKIEILYLHHTGNSIIILADRRLEVGWNLQGPHSLTLSVKKHRGSEYILQPSVTIAKFLKLLQHDGATPLPPYLRHSPLTERERRAMYQTFFAKRAGSAAAPTASLHFTKGLLKKLKERGVRIEFITLHVGLGTFAPLTAGHLKSKKLHTEVYEISTPAAARLNRYKLEGRPIIAVGTTVARTLESATRRGRLRPGRRATDIFIAPGYQWEFTDGLITNFHVPRSSLMMLVAALVGRERLLALYRYAIKKKFGFFSFGDGMLIR